MQFSDDRTVKYAVSYTKTATALSSQVEGQVVLSNTGTASTWLAKVQVELTQGAGDPRAVLADCPLNSLGKLAVPAASGGAPGKLTCTFRVSGLNATGGQLRAYAALATEEVKASSSMQLDPSTSAKVTSGYCALVGESYQPGAGYLDALVSSRSAAEAKQQTICESQDVNFEDTFGPFNDSQCGSLKVGAGGRGRVRRLAEAGAVPAWRQPMRATPLRVGHCEVPASASHVHIAPYAGRHTLSQRCN